MPFRLLVFFAAIISCAAAPVKIACVGDSITEGTGLGSNENYPARLQRLLRTNDFTVRNFGVSGRTMLKRGDLPYWKEAAFTNSQTFNPDIVLLQLGTNDGKPYNWIYGTNFISDYKAMLAIYASLPGAPRIYICVPCPVFNAGAYDINPGTIRTNIVPAIRGIATELSLPMIDLNARMTNATLFPDNVHPNSNGMAAMAAVMFEGLNGGLPAEEPPMISFERQTSTRLVVSWPAKWGALVPEVATSFSVARPWNTLSGIAYANEVMIRQTNFLTAASQRYFRLTRP